jgi:hypothetical protein
MPGPSVRGSIPFALVAHHGLQQPLVHPGVDHDGAGMVVAEVGVQDGVPSASVTASAMSSRSLAEAPLPAANRTTALRSGPMLSGRAGTRSCSCSSAVRTTG